MLKSFYGPFVLTVGGMLFYHVSQKSVPREINPFIATIIAYLAGIVVCSVFAFTYSEDKSFAASLKHVNWAVFALGAAAAFIEVGFMLVYRVGWRISLAAVATNVAATVVLIPIGILIFKEQLSLRNIIGVIFCLAGLILVVRD
ncbi:MAG TPA: EamA family transporter [Pyrinomonadaceae bacterium]|nr:EamA family transporter [Pyrinomonadaceae bacterium]